MYFVCVFCKILATALNQN